MDVIFRVEVAGATSLMTLRYHYDTFIARVAPLKGNGVTCNALDKVLTSQEKWHDM